MRYSIIYIEFRSEISEKLSVGLIVDSGEGLVVRYSPEKLHVAVQLLNDSQRKAVCEYLRQLPDNDKMKSIQDAAYMNRYSNNLIRFSTPQTIDLEPTQQNMEWLFGEYVFTPIKL